MPRVKSFVKSIIEQHRRSPRKESSLDSDFVDVLLSLQGGDKLDEEDMIAVLWVGIVCHILILFFVSSSGKRFLLTIP